MNEMVVEMERNPKNWTTRRCMICGDKFPKFHGGDWKLINLDVDYCPDCMREDTGFKE